MLRCDSCARESEILFQLVTSNKKYVKARHRELMGVYGMDYATPSVFQIVWCFRCVSMELTATEIVEAKSRG